MSENLDALKKDARSLGLYQSRVKLKPRGAEFEGLCPFHAEKTPSFQVFQKPDGWTFTCQGCKKGGDVLKFIELFDKCSFKEALAVVMEFLGKKEWHKDSQEVQDNFKPVESEATKKVKLVLTAAQWTVFEKALDTSKEAQDWLLTVRGITYETAKAMRLGFAQGCKYRIKEEHESIRNSGWVLFPRVVGEKILAVKYRSIKEKSFSQIPGMESSTLFNLDTINALEPIFLTEGELDTCALEQAGFRAVSVPSAGAKLTPEMRDKLKLAECIYLAGDNDGTVGSEYMLQLHRELGEKTYLLLWPEAKDANEFFMGKCQGNKDEFYSHVNTLMNVARTHLVDGFDPLLSRLRSSQDTDMASDPRRLQFPHKTVDDMNYNPPGSCVIFLSTYSGTGKTMFKTEVLVHEALRGEIVVDFSPEIRGEQYLSLITSQMVGPHRPNGLRRSERITREDKIECANRLEKEATGEFRYYVGHSLPVSSTDEVLEFIENVIKVTGCTRFAVDTFHRLVFTDKGSNQVEAEGRLIKKLEGIGIKYGTIFILICQSNKEAESIDNLKKDELGRLRGSREMNDVPSGIYLLHRKRRSQKDGQDPDKLLELETLVLCQKDRYTGPGKPQTKLFLKEEHSRFYEMAGPSVEEEMREEL